MEYVDDDALKHVGIERVALAYKVAKAAATLTQESFICRYNDQLCDMHLKRSHESESVSYVVKHTGSGLYIKVHPNEQDALLQQSTMNKLAATLQDGLSAVRHPYIVIGRKAVSLIEPAPGGRGSLRAFMRNSDGIHSEIYKLHQKLDQQIGRLCARVLVNDLTRGDNVGGNILVMRV